MLGDLKEGDELTFAWLNELRELCRAGGVQGDASSGLAGYRGSTGQAVYTPKAPPRWCLLTSDLGAGLYAATEKVPIGPGTWQDGTTFEAREPNGLTGLTGAYVRSLYNLAYDEWTFEKVTC